MGKCISKDCCKEYIFEPREVNLDKKTEKWIPEDVSWKDTVKFVPPFTFGRVIKVYDGDTITIACVIACDQKKTLYRMSVRLKGIDTPEIKTHDVNEYEVAMLAKTSLSKLIKGKMIRLVNTENDKYGRLLADVYLGELHLNQWLLDQHFAVAYDGGKKRSPENWLSYYHERHRIHN